MMTPLLIALLGSALAVPLYAYVGYPLMLRLLAAVRPRPHAPEPPAEWPMVSITVPAHNEAAQIRPLIASLLALDYPADRRQILIISDGSTDATPQIVSEYADRGVELLRLPERSGKTAAENAALRHLRGGIIINTDASVRLHPAAVKRLVTHMTDPSVGLASGRDVSVARLDRTANPAEAHYVSYEMWVRDLESRVGGIIGASGCCYAIRAELHWTLVPEALSRDFAAAMNAREHGFRAVSVGDALCYVPRTASLRREYRRKVRTITRGMETLFYKRRLLNPLRYGVFAWMLWSHKVCRWAVPWAGVAAAVAMVGLAPASLRVPLMAAVILGTSIPALVVAVWPAGRPMPRLLAAPAFAVSGNLAAMSALIRAVRGELDPIWEPTRRELEGGTRPESSEGAVRERAVVPIRSQVAEKIQ